jgi:hypothetical protein
MIGLRPPKVVKSSAVEIRNAASHSIAGFSIGRLELIELCVALRLILTLRCFPVEVGAGAIVKRSVEIDPNLDIGIAFVFRSVRCFGEAELDQYAVEEGKIGVISAMIRRSGSWISGCAYRVIRPDPPANRASHENHREDKIGIAAAGV